MSKKIFMLLFLAIMLPQVYGTTTFPNSIIVQSYNYTLNITTEEDSRIFDCNQNTTTSYVFNLKRNITDCGKLNNDIDKLLSTCNSFSAKYGDMTNYFQLYATCDTENKLCKRDLQEKDKTINELKSYKSSYEYLNNEFTVITGIVIPTMRMNVTSLHTNYTLCQQSLVIEGSNKILWFFGGMILIGSFWGYQKRKDTHNPKRSRIPLAR